MPRPTPEAVAFRYAAGSMPPVVVQDVNLSNPLRDTAFPDAVVNFYGLWLLENISSTSMQRIAIIPSPCATRCASQTGLIRCCRPQMPCILTP